MAKMEVEVKENWKVWATRGIISRGKGKEPNNAVYVYMATEEIEKASAAKHGPQVRNIIRSAAIDDPENVCPNVRIISDTDEEHQALYEMLNGKAVKDILSDKNVPDEIKEDISTGFVSKAPWIKRRLAEARKERAKNGKKDKKDKGKK